MEVEWYIYKYVCAYRSSNLISPGLVGQALNADIAMLRGTCCNTMRETVGQHIQHSVPNVEFRRAMADMYKKAKTLINCNGWYFFLEG